jgi:23S rRNA (guanosine2251-2'-O)-methyltransferase
MWVYGFHPVREALRSSGTAVLRVLAHRGRQDTRFREIEELCRDHGIELSEVSEAELDRKAGEVHNGFAAELEPATVRSDGSADLVVLVEDVQDPRNLGALLRVCDAAGVGRVLVRDRGSTQVTAAAVKASAGAASWLPVERIVNSAATLEELRDQGYWIYGAAAGGSPPWEFDLTGRVVLCIGGEAKGLRRLTRERCDALVGLPMAGQVESLNLSTAAAAILFDIVRQRSG